MPRSTSAERPAGPHLTRRAFGLGAAATALAMPWRGNAALLRIDTAYALDGWLLHMDQPVLARHYAAEPYQPAGLAAGMMPADDEQLFALLPYPA